MDDSQREAAKRVTEAAEAPTKEQIALAQASMDQRMLGRKITQARNRAKRMATKARNLELNTRAEPREVAHAKRVADEAARELTELESQLLSEEQMAKLRIQASESVKLRNVQKSAMRKLEAEVQRRVDAIRYMAKQREDLTESIKQLEAMVQKLPLAIRGKYRGFGRLSEYKTKEAQQRYLDRAAVRLQRIFDEYFYKERK